MISDDFYGRQNIQRIPARHESIEHLPADAAVKKNYPSLRVCNKDSPREHSRRYKTEECYGCHSRKSAPVFSGYQCDMERNDRNYYERHIQPA